MTEDELARRKALARRKLLTKLGVGGAALTLPAEWTKPIVQSIVVPAHAQTKS